MLSQRCFAGDEVAKKAGAEMSQMGLNVKLLLAASLLPFCASATLACGIPLLSDNVGDPTRKRAAVAFVDRASKSVFLSWRLLGADRENIAFDVYRCEADKAPVKVNDSPIIDVTHVLDASACGSPKDCRAFRWIVAARVNDKVVDVSVPVTVSNETGQGFTSVATGIGGFGRSLAMGDLTGDGLMDFTLRYSDVTVDPYYKLWRASPGTYKLGAFSANGEPLWRYDMGPSIERGIWYSPYLVYDLDQDGAAEVIVKGGDDTVARDDLVDASGRVSKGDELLKIISGKDGKTVLATAPWPDRTGFIGGSEPHSEYNLYSRNQLAIAYVDGKTPHVVVVRGTYGKQKVHVYRYTRQEGLSLAWRWENENPRPFKKAGDMKTYRKLDKWWGQGAHTVRVGDLDADGNDEIIIGSVALDNDGSPLWSFNRGDLDHIYLGDLDPGSPGLEVYYGAERGHAAGGMGTVSARTGKVLWQHKSRTTHIHKEGLCADLYLSHPGTECYSGEADHSSYWTWSRGGKVLAKDDLGGLAPKAAYWGAGAQKSLIRLHTDSKALLLADIVDVESGAVIDQLHRPSTMSETDREYFKILAVADIIGDWREEILAVDRGHLVVFMSTIPTRHRVRWLMDDRTYKMNAILSSMGYYHQPLLGYDLSTALGTAPRSNKNAASDSGGGPNKRQ